LIIFNATPRVMLAPTSDPFAIDQIFNTTLSIGAGGDVPAAVALALKQLSLARVAAGAVIVISDGVGTEGAGAHAQAVASAAQAAHVPIFTVGLQDSSSSANSTAQLAQIAGGKFVPATETSLSQVLARIVNGLARGYVVRYRSQQRAGQQVALTARVDGSPGTVSASYHASAPPRVAPPPASPGGPAQHRSLPQSSLLAPTPIVPGVVGPQSHLPQTFWSSSASGVAVAGVCGLLIALAISMLLGRTSKRAVRSRVSNFIPGQGGLEDDTPVGKAPSGNLLVRLIEGGRWWAPFVESVAVARSPRSPRQLVARSAAAGAGAAVVLAVGSGSVVLGLLPLLSWPFVLRALMNRAARKQREHFRELLPSHLQDLAGAMRAGRSVVAAIDTVAESADEPIRSEFERAVTDEQLGRPLDESLDAVGHRMDSDEMGQIALIAALNRRSGSNVAEAIERVADGARERADMRRELKALTGQAKMSSLVLTALPPVMLLGITVLAPAYGRPLLHTTGGLVLMGVGAAMVLAGWKVMMRIINLDP
jgi:Flp pilus assembly protein TadB